MTTLFSRPPHRLSLVLGLLIFLEAPRLLLAEPTPADLAAFHAYTQAVESRLARQHTSSDAFVVLRNPSSDRDRLRHGELILDRILDRITDRTTDRNTEPAATEPPNALLHHWRGTAFAPGATAADFEHLLRNFRGYPQHFAPQVLSAGSVPLAPNRLQASMRIRQHHVLTVVMDTAYDVSFGQLDLQHGYSISQSTRIAEIASPGTASEHALRPQDEHGFLWRLNTYWSYEERDGGLYLQIESVSLTRSIPTGLGWAIRPYIESIPRESLEFTLRSAVNAIRH